MVTKEQLEQDLKELRSELRQQELNAERVRGAITYIELRLSETVEPELDNNPDL